MILEYKGDRVNQEIMALAINMATEVSIASVFALNGGFKHLAKKAFKTLDPLLFKMLKTIVSHEDLAIKFKFLVNP
jgi:hypothetical protein